MYIVPWTVLENSWDVSMKYPSNRRRFRVFLQKLRLIGEHFAMLEVPDELRDSYNKLVIIPEWRWCIVRSEIDYIKVGKRIRDARKSMNITQESLSEICGCTSKHLSSVENGKKKPSIELLTRLSSALEVSVDSFLVDSPASYRRQIYWWNHCRWPENAYGPSIENVKRTVWHGQHAY